MNRTAFKLAASTMIVSVTMVACTAQSEAMRRGIGPSTKANAPSDRDAARAYENGRRALAAGNLAQAITEVESAVALSPRDAGYRHLLAEAYLKSGRFESARATFADVVELDPSNTRARLSLALMHVAAGRPQAAVGQLDELHGRAAPADLGLAYALAGLPERGIEILGPAARAGGATPRLRQNLALAYALAGDWVRARAVAAQDLSPAEVPARLQAWASMARPDAGSSRVAALIGVSPVGDPGQPQRLALGPASAPVALASADVPEAEAPIAEAPLQVAAAPAAPPAASARGLDQVIRMASAEPVSAPRVAPRAESAPVRDDSVSDWGLPASSNPAPAEAAEAAAPAEAPSHYLPAAPAPAPVATPAEARFVSAARSLSRPNSAVVRTASASLPSSPAFRRPAAVQPRADQPQPDVRRGNAPVVVQLGAFISETNAERAWQTISQRHRLNAHVPLTTTIAIDGRVLHRVSVAGFSGRTDAVQLCESIRSSGGVCFVRSEAGDASIRWAARYTNSRNRNA